MSLKKIVMVIAHKGFQSIEYSVPKTLFTNTGHEVVTASNKIGTATAHDGSTTHVDLLIESVNPNECNGIIFVGGPGSLENLDNEYSYTLARQAVEEEKPLGAICVATRILAKAGVLKDQKATGWNGDDKLKEIYQEYGAKYVAEEVVVDDLIVTATGPSVAHDFAQEMLRLIENEQ